MTDKLGSHRKDEKNDLMFEGLNDPLCGINTEKQDVYQMNHSRRYRFTSDFR